MAFFFFYNDSYEAAAFAYDCVEHVIYILSSDWACIFSSFATTLAHYV